MRLGVLAVLLTMTVVSLGGCARPRPCPPGYHLGPAGMACRLN